MQHVINHLIQLQELTLIRAEHQASPGKGRKNKANKDLDESISHMTKELEPDIRRVFRDLQKRDLVAVVPVASNACAACGMATPISLVQAVRAAEQLQRCPNCTRILYYPTTGARSIGQRVSRTARPKVGIERFSSESLMVPSLTATTREEAITELAEKMEEEGFVHGADKLVDEALRREGIVTTAVDHGLAFPHVRGVEGGGLTVAVGISRKGFRFGDDAKGLTRFVFFTVIPTSVNVFYLKLLAGLTETFMQTDARKKLQAAKTAEQLWKTLTRLTKSTIP